MMMGPGNSGMISKNNIAVLSKDAMDLIGEYLYLLCPTSRLRGGGCSHLKNEKKMFYNLA